MSMIDHVEKIESMVTSGRVPGTARSLVNLERITEVLSEMRADVPEQINEAQAVLRQKEAVLKQAEMEARRIRGYADEEATTIRQLAEEQSSSMLETSREEARKMVEASEVTKASHERANEIIQEAEAKAAQMIADAKQSVNGIIADAEQQAEERRKGADNYAREVLFSLEERIADTLGQVRGGIDLLDSRSLAVAD